MQAHFYSFARRSAIVASLLAFFAVTIAQGDQTQDSARSNSTGPVFAEPVSGRPVDQYMVSLPTNAAESHEFIVPQDCNEIRQNLENGAADRSRVVERRLWLKAESDCRYYSRLNRHHQDDLVDFLGNTNFRSLDLRTLPLDVYCDRRPGSLCTPKAHAGIEARPLFSSKAKVPADKRDQYSSTPCHLTAGRFHGRVCRDGDTLLCVPDSGSIFRLVGVDYGDVDGDGIRDAVLRLNILSPRTGRRLVRIPVTRLSEDGALKLTATHRETR